MSFDLDIGFTSQTGKKPTNEDFAAAMLPERGQEGMGAIVAIADGVSTGGMGREAAQTTVTSLVRDYFGTPETWDTTVALDRIIGAQNAWLAGINRRRHPALGLCTLTALVLRGLRAGDGGFQVNVKGDTTLTGGAITSTDKAVNEGKNSFTTGGTLTTTDVQNEARYKGDGFAASITVAGGEKEKPPEGQESRTQAMQPQTGGSAGMGEDSGNTSRVTTAGISGIAGDKDKRTGDAEQGIAPIFDKDKVKDSVQGQITITAEFGKQASSAWGTYANKQFVDAVAAGDEEAAGCWAPDGACRAGGHALIGGLSGGVGGAAGAGLSSVAAPNVEAFLVANGVSNDAAKAITQLSALGAGVAVGGAAGGVAGFNEASNNAVVAIPLLVEGIVAGGALAARACLSSPACLNALRLGGTALVAKVASLVAPDELAQIPGFAPAPQNTNLHTGNTKPNLDLGPNHTGGSQLDTPPGTTVTGGSQIPVVEPGDNVVGGGFGAGTQPIVDPVVMSAADRAGDLGYDRVVKDPPFNSHGQPVFTNGRDFITPDVDQHNGGEWKKFDRRGRRTGTYDSNLDRIGK